MRRFVATSAASLQNAQIYRLMTGFVVPRPIALVSTLSASNVPNLAPFSFFNVLSMEPPTIGISVGLRGGHARKDTLINVEATSEFVVNVVSMGIAEQANTASLDWTPDVDEFDASRLTPIYENLIVKAPRVAESPVHLECRLTRLIDFGDYTFVVGEVVAFHYRNDVCDDRLYIDHDRLAAVGRLAGFNYCSTADRFALQRSADSPDRRRPSK